MAEDGSILCPKCGEPMRAGYCRAQSGIHWRAEDEQPLRWRFMWNALPNTLAWATFRENRAWRCPECDYLVVDHSASFPSRKLRGS